MYNTTVYIDFKGNHCTCILCILYSYSYGRTYGGSTTASPDNESEPASVIRRLTESVASGAMAATSAPSSTSRATPAGYSAAKSTTTPASTTTSTTIAYSIWVYSTVYTISLTSQLLLPLPSCLFLRSIALNCFNVPLQVCCLHIDCHWLRSWLEWIKRINKESATSTSGTFCTCTCRWNGSGARVAPIGRIARLAAHSSATASRRTSSRSSGRRAQKQRSSEGILKPIGGMWRMKTRRRASD